MSHRRAPLLGARREPQARLGIPSVSAADRGQLRHPEREREIHALHRVLSQLRLEALAGSVVLGNYQETTRVFVDAVHDARTERPLIVLRVRAQREPRTRQKTIYQRAI